MPRKLDRAVRKIMAQGKSKSSAYAIASSQTGIKRGKKNTGVQTKKKK